jgi:type II secretory pathway component PulF
VGLEIQRRLAVDELVERLRDKADEMDRRMGVTNTQALLREAAAALEAARAEVERLQSDTSFATAISSLRREKERADKLAEALRLAEEHINSLTPEWYSAGQRVLAEIRAAIAQARGKAGQEAGK